MSRVKNNLDYKTLGWFLVWTDPPATNPQSHLLSTTLVLSNSCDFSVEPVSAPWSGLLFPACLYSSCNTEVWLQSCHVGHLKERGNIDSCQSNIKEKERKVCTYNRVCVCCLDGPVPPAAVDGLCCLLSIELCKKTSYFTLLINFNINSKCSHVSCSF